MLDFLRKNGWKWTQCDFIWTFQWIMLLRLG